MRAVRVQADQRRPPPDGQAASNGPSAPWSVNRVARPGSGAGTRPFRAPQVSGSDGGEYRGGTKRGLLGVSFCIVPRIQKRPFRGVALSRLVRSESPRRAPGDACLRPERGSRECCAIRAESSSIEGFGLGLSGPSGVLASASASAFAFRGTHVILMSANCWIKETACLCKGLRCSALTFLTERVARSGRLTSGRCGWFSGWRRADSLTFCRPIGLTYRMSCRPSPPEDHRRDLIRSLALAPSEICPPESASSTQSKGRRT